MSCALETLPAAKPCVVNHFRQTPHRSGEEKASSSPFQGEGATTQSENTYSGRIRRFGEIIGIDAKQDYQTIKSKISNWRLKKKSRKKIATNHKLKSTGTEKKGGRRAVVRSTVERGERKERKEAAPNLSDQVSD